MKKRKKILLKFGSKSLVNNERTLSDSIKQISETADQLFSQGYFPIIVSSGAVRAGKHELQGTRVSAKDDRRYFSAVGQSKIVEEYASCLRQLPNKLRTSQILISRRTFSNREVYNDISNVFNEYAADGIIPIMNDNDFTYDSAHDFSDNDQLAAFIAIMSSCEHVVMFSDVDGIFSSNPHKHPDLFAIQDIASLENIRVDKSNISNGGIRSKVDSALILDEFGVNHTVCAFSNLDKLGDLLSGTSQLGSTFIAGKPRLKKGIQRWLRAGSISNGIIVVSDKGTNAISAVSKRKSLLQSGVEAIYGDFVAGDVVSIRSADFEPLAVGISNYASWELLDGLKNRSDVEKSTSHRDAVVSANYSAVKTREYFKNSDSHLVTKYISRYKKKLHIDAISDSEGSIIILRSYIGSRKEGDVQVTVPVRDKIAYLDRDYWEINRDVLSKMKRNLEIGSWPDFWVFKYAFEGDILNLPHWKRYTDD